MIEPQTQSTVRKNVLIVEDDPDISETLVSLLEEEGYDVARVANGQLGLEALERVERPCLILLDLMMPVLDGFGFLDGLEERTDSGCFPVLVLSANPRLHEALNRPPVRGCLRKPFNLQDLLAQVARYSGGEKETGSAPH